MSGTQRRGQILLLLDSQAYSLQEKSARSYDHIRVMLNAIGNWRSKIAELGVETDSISTPREVEAGESGV